MFHSLLHFTSLHLINKHKKSKMRGVQLAMILVGLLLAMTQQSMQFGSLEGFATERPPIKKTLSASIALILSSDATEKALLASGVFTPSLYIPYFDIAGRRFHIGSINALDVIYVKSGGSMINAAVTTQTLIDSFSIRGIIVLGPAGALIDELWIADVTVLQKIAHTGNWQWEKYGSKSKKGQLNIGKYNYPNGGDNFLESTTYLATDTYGNKNPGKAKKVFWFEPDSNWLSTAAMLEGFRLEACINGTKCLPYTPKVYNGARASTADIYVKNAAYRGFLKQQFTAAIVDTESAAIALTASANDKPYIVFRGISNTAGGSTANSSYSSLATVNVVQAVLKFLTLIPVPYAAS